MRDLLAVAVEVHHHRAVPGGEPVEREGAAGDLHPLEILRRREFPGRWKDEAALHHEEHGAESEVEPREGSDEHQGQALEPPFHRAHPTLHSMLRRGRTTDSRETE